MNTVVGWGCFIIDILAGVVFILMLLCIKIRCSYCGEAEPILRMNFVVRRRPRERLNLLCENCYSCWTQNEKKLQKIKFCEKEI